MPVLPWLALVALAARLVPAATALCAAALALPLVAGALCTWLAVASWLSLDAHPRALAVTALLGLLVVPATTTPRRRASGVDVAALGCGLATLVALYRPFAGASAGTRMALLSRTADAGTHVQMVRAAARTSGYFMLLPDPSLEGTRGVASYPPGFSGVFAALVPHTSDGGLDGLVNGVALGVCLIVALIAYLSVHLAVVVAGDKRSPAHLVAVSAAVLALTAVGPAALLLEDGAFAQLLALVAVLAGLLVTTASPPDLRLAICLAGVTVLCAHAWYLVVPALLVPWLGVLGSGRLGFAARGVLVAVVAPLCLFPVLQGPGASQLELAGFVDLPRASTAWLFLVALVAAMAIVVRGTRDREARLPLLGAVVMLLLTSVFLGTMQGVRTGSLAYYFFKVLLAGCVLAVPLMGAALLALTGTGRHRLGAAGLAVPLTLVALFVADPTTRAAVAGHPKPSLVGGLQATDGARQGLEGSQVSALLDEVVRKHPGGLDAAHDVWFVGCQRAQSYVLSKWLYDSSLGWTAQRRYLVDSTRFPSRDLERDLRARLKDSDLVHMDLYRQRGCAPWAEVMGQDPRVSLETVP